MTRSPPSSASRPPVAPLPLVLLVVALVVTGYGGVSLHPAHPSANPTLPPASAAATRAPSTLAGPRPHADTATVLDTIGLNNGTVRPGAHTYSGGQEPLNVTEEGDRAFVTQEYSNTVAIVNTTDGALVDEASTGFYPQASAYDSLNGYLYVTDQYGQTITVLNPENGALLYNLSVPGYLDSVLFDPVHNQLIVSIGTSDFYPGGPYQVLFLNPATGAVFGSVNVGGDPYALALASALDLVFVGNEATSNVSVIDTSTYLLVTTLPYTPDSLAYDPVTEELFIANSGSVVTVLNASTDVVVGSPNVRMDPESETYDPATGTIDLVGTYDNEVLTEIYASNLTVVPYRTFDPGYWFWSSVVYAPDTGDLLVLNTLGDNLTELDPTTLAEPQATQFGFSPVNSAIDPTNDYLYVANYYTNNVSVINLLTDRSLPSVPVGIEPSSILYDPASGDIDVGNFFTGVSVIDPTTDTVVATLAQGWRVNAMVYDPADQDLYLADEDGSQPTGNLTVLNGATGAIVQVDPMSSDLTTPYSVTYDTATRTIYLVSITVYTGNLTAVNPSTYQLGTPFPLPTEPLDVAYDPGNGYLAVGAVGDGGPYLFYFVDPTTGTIVATEENVSDLYADAWDSAADLFLVSNQNANDVEVFAGASTAPTTTFGVGVGPAGSTYDPTSGLVYVTNEWGSSVEVIRLVVAPDVLSVSTSPASCGPVSLNGTLTSGTVSLPSGAYSLSAPACYDYGFTGWATTGGVQVAASTESTQLTLSANGTLTAMYALVADAKFGVGLSVDPASCGDAVTIGATSYGNGSTAQLALGTYQVSAGPCAGYTFSAWLVAGADSVVVDGPLGGVLTVAGNGTLAAAYVPVPSSTVPTTSTSSGGYSETELVAFVAAGIFAGAFVGVLVGRRPGHPRPPTPPVPVGPPTPPGAT
jgi:YVTN family beta-propeller protein